MRYFRMRSGLRSKSSTWPARPLWRTSQTQGRSTTTRSTCRSSSATPSGTISSFNSCSPTPQATLPGARPASISSLREYLTGKGTLAEKDWAWDELLAFLEMARLPPVNVLLSTYWTMGAVRHGDFVAKVRFAPVRGVCGRCRTPRGRSGIRSRRLPAGARGGAASSAPSSSTCRCSSARISTSCRSRT